MSYRRIWLGSYPVLPGMEVHLKFDLKRYTVLTDGLARPGFLAAYEGNPNSAPRPPICPDSIRLPKGMNGKKMQICKKRGRPRLTKEELANRSKELPRPPPVPNPFTPIPNPYLEPARSSTMVVNLREPIVQQVPLHCLSLSPDLITPPLTPVLIQPQPVRVSPAHSVDHMPEVFPLH